MKIKSKIQYLSKCGKILMKKNVNVDVKLKTNTSIKEKY